MPRFNFKRVDINSGVYINLLNEYNKENTVIIQSLDVYDTYGKEIYEHDILVFSDGEEEIFFEIYYNSALCRFEVEVTNMNKEIEFGDFLLNYLPFSKKIGNSLIKNEVYKEEF